MIFANNYYYSVISIKKLQVEACGLCLLVPVYYLPRAPCIMDPERLIKFVH